MSSCNYKHKSGSQKRKERDALEEKRKKFPRITNFLSASTSKRTENLIDTEETSAPAPSEIYAQELSPNTILVTETETVLSEHVSSISSNTNINVNQSIDSSLDTLVSKAVIEEIHTDKGYYTGELTSTQKRIIIDNNQSRPLGPFIRDDKGRSFSSFFYTKITKSGIKTERLWLCFSPILNQCYCQPCRLFSTEKDSIANGFNDWNHLHQAITRHEQKQSHNESCAVYDRWRRNDTIDHELEAKILQEASVWRQILERVMEVTLTLASSNMPFRGHDESSNSSNPGPFLSIIYLLSKYDLVLKNLLENKTKKSVTYLSPTIQNEIIGLISTAVKNEIIDQIKKAAFYSIIIDTTQDIAKIDQLSVVIRVVTVEYIEDKPTKIIINESFLGFIPVESQTGTALSKTILRILTENDIPLEKLRGQGYDGAANMSGIYKGVQAQISTIVPNAVYVHCAAHNLNLIINDSVKSVDEIRNFYDLIESIYVFFGHSIKRWALLSKCFDESVSKSKTTLKKLNPTRWSSRHDALDAARFKYVNVLKVLSQIILISNNKSEVDETNSLKKKIELFETVFLIVLQSKILKFIDALSKLLQNKEQNIEQTSKMFNTAFENIKKLRNNFDLLISESDSLAAEWGVKAESLKKRKTRPKQFFDEKRNHFQIESNEDWFKINVFYATLDIIISQLKNRTTGISAIYKTFRGFSVDVLNNDSVSDDELYRMGQELYVKYSDDISDTISSQLISFRSCFKGDLGRIKSIRELMEFILIENFSSCSSFSEILTACYIFLSIPVSVATAERSFSKLKLIKSFLRNTMGLERLSGLSILSIENKIARKIDVSSIVTTFANLKARKKKSLDQ